MRCRQCATQRRPRSRSPAAERWHDAIEAHVLSLRHHRMIRAIRAASPTRGGGDGDGTVTDDYVLQQRWENRTPTTATATDADATTNGWQQQQSSPERSPQQLQPTRVFESRHAGLSPRRGPVPAPDQRVPKGVCWICKEGAERAPLLRGCQCNGGLGCCSHLLCLVQAAQMYERTWKRCAACGSHWTGEIAKGLAWTRFGLLNDRPEDDPERLALGVDCVVALASGGEYAEAMNMVGPLLVTLRRHHGDEHDAVRGARLIEEHVQEMLEAQLDTTLHTLTGEGSEASPTFRLSSSGSRLSDLGPDTNPAEHWQSQIDEQTREKRQEQAVIVVQAAARGAKGRQLAAAAAATATTEAAQQEAAAAAERAGAATTIQAAQRGKLGRVRAGQRKMHRAAGRRRTDEHATAAVAIQSAQRGRAARKRVGGLRAAAVAADDNDDENHHGKGSDAARETVAVESEGEQAAELARLRAELAEKTQRIAALEQQQLAQQPQQPQRPEQLEQQEEDTAARIDADPEQLLSKP